MTNYVNLTSHVMRVLRDGHVWSIEPSGSTARLEEGNVERYNKDGLDFSIVSYGEIRGLPEPEEDTYYIVSSKVFHATERKDVIAPDTGKTAVRSESGYVNYVKGFLAH